MIDFSYILQRVIYYMQNPEQLFPPASDARQAAEIKKMRKALSDFFDAKREIRLENQNLAIEIICSELARQMVKDQQGGKR